LLGPPDPVMNVLATRTVLSADIMSIMISWDEPTGSFDPVTSYIIMGCANTSNGTFPQCPSITPVLMLPSNITQASINVSTMTSYFFNIIAENINGQSLPSSNITVPERKCIEILHT